MEPPRVLESLARRNPDHTFIIVSICRDDPQACGYPSNVINSWTTDRLSYMREMIKPHQEVIREDKDKTERSLNAIRGIQEVMDRLLQPIAEKLTGAVIWAGQHGTANSVLPAVTERSGVPGFTRPYDSFTFYGGGIYRMINTWRDISPFEREEVWLIADPRNHLKARDQKWPLRHPVLGQFNFSRDLHHERYDGAADGGLHAMIDEPTVWNSKWKTNHTWVSPIDYVYSGLELCSITPEFIGNQFELGESSRRPFGLFINEAGYHAGQGKSQEASGRLQRRPIVQDWVLPLSPAFIHGKWTTASQKALGITIEPAPFENFYPLLRSVRSTFTTPSSGSGWATTKPWEAFAAGTACFRHPFYDTQDHIYGQLKPEVREWLSPPTPQDLWSRVNHLTLDHVTWQWIVQEQYDAYTRAVEERQWLKMIEERL